MGADIDSVPLPPAFVSSNYKLSGKLLKTRTEEDQLLLLTFNTSKPRRKEENKQSALEKKFSDARVFFVVVVVFLHGLSVNVFSLFFQIQMWSCYGFMAGRDRDVETNLAPEPFPDPARGAESPVRSYFRG